MKEPFWQRPGAWRHGAFWLVFAGVLAWVSSSPSLRDPTVVKGNVGIVGSSWTSDGANYFVLAGDATTYAIRAPDAAIEQALEASASSGNSIRFNVHLDGAYFELWSGDPDYWIESFEYLGKKFGPFEPMLRRSWRSMPPARAALLRGMAYDAAGQAQAAADALQDLDLPSLRKSQRVLALKTRGNALESLAYADQRAENRDDDALLIRALRDYLAAAQLAPDNSQLLFWQAGVLETLGDYQQAADLYEKVARRWPKQAFRAGVFRAANYRKRGAYLDALRELDKLRDDGRSQGMMYHYHRAWTLQLLGRHEEVVQELNAGFQTQPDYAWAFQKRACARGQLGQLDQAIADQSKFIGYMDKIEDAADSEAFTTERAEYRSQLEALEAARLDRPGSPTAVACIEYSGPRYSRRDPSRLLKDL